MTICRAALALVAVSFFMAVPARAGDAIVPTSEAVSSYLASSDGLRTANPNHDLERVFLKAKRGEPLVIAAIGGSITQGALASSPEKRWFYLTVQWWKKTFPNNKITLVNEGLSATGSAQGAIRVRPFLEHHKPDVVFIEFCVNDFGITDYNTAEAMEGLIRQIQSLEGKPAVILVCDARRNLASAESSYLKVAAYYNVPVVSMLPVLRKLGASNQLDSFFGNAGETIHPSDEGHKYIAQTTINYLEKALASTQASSATDIPLPKPLISDKYENAVLLNADNLKPIRNSGWSAWWPGNMKNIWWGGWWESNAPGSTIMFEIEGTEIGIMFHKEKAGMGMAKITVDNLPPAYLNAYFADDWGGGVEAFHILASNLERKKHVIAVELLNDKDPKSDGHRFAISGFSAAGASESFCRDANTGLTLDVPDSTVVFN